MQAIRKLEQLEQANLFIIPLDDARQWFRYHQLFADLLRQRLRLANADMADLYQRAAVWLDESGFHADNVLSWVPATQWLTWGFHVMPVFFLFVGI